jgi:hypothetical protein
MVMKEDVAFFVVFHGGVCSVLGFVSAKQAGIFFFGGGGVPFGGCSRTNQVCGYR